jgi:hypothetical protein
VCHTSWIVSDVIQLVWQSKILVSHTIQLVWLSKILF